MSSFICYGRAAMISREEIITMRAALADVLGVAQDELFAPSRRKAPTAFARHVGMYLMHEALGFSYSAVGRCFGRDRTTCRASAAIVENLRDDVSFDIEIERLENALKARIPELEGHDD